MPKLSIVIDINQHGDQTFRIDGDQVLWPLVGRLAAAAQTPIHTGERHNTLAGGTGPHAMSDAAELAWFADFWSRTTERACIVGRAMGGRRFAVLDATDPRLADAEHHLKTALVTLGWKGSPALQAWAEIQRARLSEHTSICEVLETRIARLHARDPEGPQLSPLGAVKGLLEDAAVGVTNDAAYAELNAATAPIRERLQLPASTSPLEVLTALFEAYKSTHADAEAIEGQVDSIDAVLRPLVIASEDDSPEEVADLAAARIRGAEEQDERIRAVLEAAIGRTPDPSRSTLQLAHDLVGVLKAALEH